MQDIFRQQDPLQFFHQMLSRILGRFLSFRIYS
jgi:hypothetical protein